MDSDEVSKYSEQLAESSQEIFVFVIAKNEEEAYKLAQEYDDNKRGIDNHVWGNGIIAALRADDPE